MTVDRLAAAAVGALQDRFGCRPDGVWFAPGRVTLIGEHTDYSDGLCLPLALPLGTAAAVHVRDDDRLAVASTAQPTPVVVDPARVGPGSPPGWAAYVAGPVWQLRRAGHPVPGMDIAVAGDVPIGAGLSSSASLGCAVAAAVDDLSGAGLSRTDLAVLVQRAENVVVGMPCGVMDQMAAMHGRRGHAVLLDTRSLDVEAVPLDLPAAGLALLVVDTRATRRLADGVYAQRRATCEEAARLLGVAALRDVVDLDEALRGLPDERHRRRVRHVVTENARVLSTVHRLLAGDDPRAIGPLLTLSHASLRDDYAVSADVLDVAVEAALAAGAHGARLTGGGLGGCVIALVDVDAAAAVGTAVGEACVARGFAAPHVFPVRPSAGARRLG